MDDDFSAWAAGAEQPLLRSAYLLTGDLHRAEDLVQEAMVKVALRWGRLREGKPTAYARRIIANDHVSLWRRRGREVPVAEPTTDAAVSTDPETVLVVRRALDRLTPAQRAVVVLRHFDDLSERETAEVLGIAVGTVKSQNSAALARLRTGAPELLDLVRPAGLGESAVAEARRRRTQRRVVAATVAGVVAVVAVLVAVRAGDGDRPEPAPVAPTTDSAPVTPRVFPEWDATAIADAPQRDSVLPARLSPPDLPPSVLDQPVARAALVWPEPGRDVRILDDRGRWRCVPGTADAVAGTFAQSPPVALSDDGRQVAISTTAGLRVVDVTTGADLVVPWPKPLAGPWDSPPDLLWMPGGDQLAVLHWDDTWVMGLDGSVHRPPWGGPSGIGVAIDRDGGVVDGSPDAPGIDLWHGDLEKTLAVDYRPSYDGGRHLTAGQGRVALVGGGAPLPGLFGLVILDSATGDLVGALPVRRAQEAFNRGLLRLVGMLDPETLLLFVTPRGAAPDAEPRASYLVAWDARTGGFERLATGGPSLSGARVAVGVLAAP